jgi:hypothetical protein
MRTGIVTWLVLASLALSPVPAAAQSAPAPAELGYDLGVTIQKIDEVERTDIYVGLPASGMLVQTVRAGFPISPRGQVQTDLGLSLVAPDAGDTFANGVMGLSLLTNLGRGPIARAPFLRFGMLFRYVKMSGESDTQFGLGGGVGLKFAGGDRLAARMEGGVAKWMEGDQIRGMLDITWKIGLSFFTR